MNAKQSNTLKMGYTVSDALETITATSDVPALRANHVVLKTLLTRISDASAEQSGPLTGRTRARDRALGSAIDAGLAIGGAVLSYPQAHGLDELISKVDVSPTKLQTGRLIRRMEYLQQIHAAAASVLTELADYGVTTASLADFRAKIDAVNEQIGVSRSSIVDRRVATTRLAASVRQLQRFLSQEMDPLVGLLRLTAPDDYARYQAARVVVDLPLSPAASTPPEQAIAPAAGSSPTAPLARAA